MSDSDEVIEWIRKAENDYQGAVDLSPDENIPYLIWFVSIVNNLLKSF